MEGVHGPAHPGARVLVVGRPSRTVDLRFIGLSSIAVEQAGPLVDANNAVAWHFFCGRTCAAEVSGTGSTERGINVCRGCFEKRRITQVTSRLAIYLSMRSGFPSCYSSPLAIVSFPLTDARSADTTNLRTNIQRKNRSKAREARDR